MNRIIKSLLLLTLAVNMSCTDIANPDEMASAPVEGALATKLTGRTDGNFQQGELLIFLDETQTAKWERGEKAVVIEGLSAEMPLISMEPALACKPKNERLARQLGLHRWFVVEFDSEVQLEQAAEKIAMRPEVCAVQYNAIAEPARNHEVVPVSMASHKAPTRSGDAPFNDYYLGQQWNLINTGLLSSLAREGADIAVKDAWRLTCGDPRIVVAVMDGPVKYDHPDLAANMWVNSAEQNGIAGVDDDGNGYVDDIYGYNFANKQGEINLDGYGEIGHGTHVAGILAAVNNNGIGVSSVAGGSGNGDGVRLMSCQLFAGDVAANDRVVGNAFIYAADNGASIAQCSYGYDGGVYTSNNAYINVCPFEYRGIQYFVDAENANCEAVGQNLAIFAAGNEMASYSAYPGALDFCISVTALGPDGLPALYTNYGLGCNIAAPGGESQGDFEVEDMILSTGFLSGEYVYMSGSSMACPHVSGVAALGMSYAMKLGKRFSGEEFTAMLYGSVNDVDQYMTSGRKSSLDGVYSIDLSKYRKRMGTGSIDAWKLLMNIEGTPSLLVRTGEECEVDLSAYFGGGASTMTFTGVEIDDMEAIALGISGTPKVKAGVLTIKCLKSGSGKVTVKAIAGGGQVGSATATGGTEISREVSIISRGVSSANNGWL